MKDFKFKILVLGTSDRLRSEFLSLISQKSWRIDGVSGHFHETDGVTLDIWFPRENASSKILASFSYTGANGVIIVMGRRDRKILQRFRKIIHERVGKVPFIGVVLRKNMSEAEKAMKSLHATRVLSEKMKSISFEVNKEPPRMKETPPTKMVAGQPSYNVDPFGFIVPDAADGVPLFVDEPKKKSKRESNSK